MDRRTFLAGTGAVLLAAPLAAEAQTTGKVYRVGVLGTEPSTPWDVFRHRLRELGYVEGQNIVFEYRWSEGNVERFPGLAAELAGLKVDVIVASGNAATGALKRATATIPIVMALSGDPVGAGLVASLAHPGGNVTGLTMIASRDMAGKQMQLLKEVVPKATRVAYLFDSANPGSLLALKELEAAGRALGVGLRLTEVRSENDLEAAFAAMTRERVGAVLVPPGPFETIHRRRIIDLAAASRLPVMYGAKWFVDDGGLISYGVSIPNNFRRAATYVDKILKGAKPADLPVEQPTKFELVINLKTAKALGLTIPPSLLARADEVIQ
jgi:putative ABC transport system substrate-binding protein